MADKMGAIKKIFTSDSSSGVLLLLVTLCAIAFANLSFLKDFYDVFIHFGINETYNMHFFVNDILMAIFFFTIGLELKRERLEGQLSHFSQIFLPCFAAIGGVIFPALIFAGLNFSNEFAIKGWAIPTATDIAFTIGVIALLGKKVPFSLKIFVLTLAIMDDLYAILIIAFFYAGELNFIFLGLGALCYIALIVINRADVRTKTPYIVLSIVLWYFIYRSGIHATIAGVLAGFVIPMRAKDGSGSMLEDFENALKNVVNFAIMPLFAFVNAGVSFAGLSASYLFSSVPLGIMCGLFFGKQIGIFLFSFIAIKLKFANLPEKANFVQLYAIGILCGIGFTMSLFVDALAYNGSDAFHHADKLAILLGSMISGIVGYFIARAVGNKN